ncbi:MAG: MarC family protein [Bacteroidales bacterium]|nr:MarC family protein [Bacteroidales bacterium]
MHDLFVFGLSVFASLFAIINPIANVPIFMGVTSGASEASCRKVAKTATVTAFCIVLAFVLIGKYIFEFFGITIPAFKITGGLLLFYVGFELLQSKKSTIQSNVSVPGNGTPDPHADFDESVAISPLAIPMLAGPGTIVAAMNYAAAHNYWYILEIVLILAFVLGLTYTALIFSRYIYKFLGKDIILVLSKLMGLIVAILGTNMIIDGIKMVAA